MKVKVFLPIIILLSFVLFFACEDEPSAIGVELISSEFVSVKSFDTQTDSIEQNSSLYKIVEPLGIADRILIGKYQDITTTTLMRFIFGLNDSVKDDVLNDVINVLEAEITLTNRYVYGDTNAAMNFTVHKVNSFWSPTEFTIDSLDKLDYDMEDISIDHDISDTLHLFKISSDVVLGWLKNSADNTVESNEGLYLIPDDNSGKVIGYQALTPISSDAAKLSVVIEKPGVYTDTIRGFIFADNSLIDAPLPQLAPNLVGVQSSVTANTRLVFNLDQIPKGIVINKAELFLKRDTLNSIVGSGFTTNLSGHFITDSTTMKLESGSSITLTLTDDIYTGNITSYVRRWVNEGENQGILIRVSNFIEGLELFALYGSTASAVNRPRLKITYTVKENL